MKFAVTVYHRNRPTHRAEFAEAIELGRQKDNEPAPLASIPLPAAGLTRLVVAPQPEVHIAREQLHVRPLDDGRLLLTNVSRRIKVSINGQSTLEPSTDETTAEVVVNVPVTVHIGRTTRLEFEALTEHAQHLASLSESTRAPGEAARALAMLGVRHGSFAQDSERAQPENLVSALQAAIEVLQGAKTADELFVQAVNSAKALAGLDRVQILLHEHGEWHSSASADDSTVSRASRSVLGSVLESKRTFWSNNIEPGSHTASLAAVQSVIASPILDAGRRVIGALYGDRMSGRSNPNQGELTSLDARLFELLACSVATGWERQRHEDDARRMRLQFEQFFTPALTRELETNRELLKGQEADVSVLFCDIRGFSRISEQIGPARTFVWMNDVMTHLSDCVLRHDGVLVDYIGDELMAMWGAPRPQPNHAELACRSAFAILGLLPQLNAKWSAELKQSMDLGIGINSGAVWAGNSGSEQKFKYGPLGSAVNIASRLQGATKYLKSRLLVTGETVAALKGRFARRRLCTIRVVNVKDDIQVFELLPESADSRRTADVYEEALSAFEHRRFPESARLLAGLVKDSEDGSPALVLLSRAVKAMTEGPDDEHPVWKLPGK